MSGNWLGQLENSSYKPIKVLGMRYDWRSNSLVVLHNFDEKPQEVGFRPGVSGGERLMNLLKEEEGHSPPSGIHKMALESQGNRWFRVGDLNYVIFRERACGTHHGFRSPDQDPRFAYRPVPKHLTPS